MKLMSSTPLDLAFGNIQENLKVKEIRDNNPEVLEFMAKFRAGYFLCKVT